MIKGDSRKTLPSFHKMNPNLTCDIIVIDGGHDNGVPSMDFDNFLQFVPKTTPHLLVVDDIQFASAKEDDVAKMLKENLAKGRAAEIFRCTVRNPRTKHGFLVGKYILNNKYNEEYTKYTAFIDKLTERKYNTCHDVYNGDIQWNNEEQKRWDMFQSGLNESGYTERPRGGHLLSHPDQAKLYHEISKLSFIKTICETGFGAGHSAFLWLNSNPNVTLYSFDVHPQNSMDAVVKSIFKYRFHMILGDSRKTLPSFQKRNPKLTCDLIVIDGGHDGLVPSQDFDNFLRFVPKTTPHLLVIADAVADTWKRKLAHFRAEELFRCKVRSPQAKHGFVVGKYVLNNKINRKYT